MTAGNIKNKIPEIILLILIAGCAKVSSPTGGPRDREPPVVVKSSPANGAKNFKGNEVSVTFNEFVVLENINDKFMVSPPMKKKPKIFLRGKSVNIQYSEALRDSTTYTFNFQDAIRDLNEGNVLDNYQFVFSTGPVLDSLSVTGNVYSALSLDPPEETLVLLYSRLYDSAVVKRLPDYISRVKKNGYFRIDNVKAGKYRLYALKDADNSKNFNLPDEQFAFLNDTIAVSSPKDYLPVVRDTIKTKPLSVKMADTVVMKGKYKLILFQPPKTAHYLTSSSRSLPYKLTYTLSLPPDSAGFGFSIPGTSPGSYYIERNKNNDSILVWLTDTSLYNKPQIKTLVRYPFTDTTGKVIQKHDTILMRFLVARATRARPKKQPYSVTSNLFTGALHPGQQITLLSQTPFGTPDTSKIRLYEGSGTSRIKIPFAFIPDTANSCRMIMKTHLIQGNNYMFIANSGAFRNIYGDVSDSAGYRITIRKEDTFGKLTFNIKNYEGNRIIQLLSRDEKIVREIRMAKDGKVEFPYLDRGQYRVRVIYDLNGDGKWTTGDFNKRRQPEPVSFYQKEIEVKENWEIIEDWDIGEQNIKKVKSASSVSPGR
ncbi:MAG: Ig-like domain-containing domain [Bacteroidales bacterium]